MSDLTDRQKEILSSVIEQYAEVAVPVGSVTLAKAFDVSSATIRSEMSKLEELGYIEQPHTSAGRIPTDQGYRFFVNQINESKDKPEKAKQSVKQKANREEKAISSRITSAGAADRAIQSAVKTLVELTGNVGLATIGNSVYVRGFSSLFAQPEFAAAQTIQGVASLLDNLEPWLREAAPNKPLSVFIGQENPIGKSSGCTLVISKFSSPYSDKSYIGVLGSTRQDYRNVMKLVKHTGHMLEEALV